MSVVAASEPPGWYEARERALADPAVISLLIEGGRQPLVLPMNARPNHLNVFIVEEFETQGGKTARSWTKIGAAFPHADGLGFNLELRALPSGASSSSARL